MGDIEKKGKFGKADPYVKLTYRKQKAKSKTVKNNHNPEWNFEATFDIDENSAEGVNIAVFDDDFGKDDSLGNKTMDITVIQEKQKLLNQWIPLENCKSGEVLFFFLGIFVFFVFLFSLGLVFACSPM